MNHLKLNHRKDVRQSESKYLPAASKSCRWKSMKTGLTYPPSTTSSFFYFPIHNDRSEPPIKPHKFPINLPHPQKNTQWFKNNMSCLPHFTHWFGTSMSTLHILRLQHFQSGLQGFASGHQADGSSLLWKVADLLILYRAKTWWFP